MNDLKQKMQLIWGISIAMLLSLLFPYGWIVSLGVDGGEYLLLHSLYAVSLLSDASAHRPASLLSPLRKADSGLTVTHWPAQLYRDCQQQ